MSESLILIVLILTPLLYSLGGIFFKPLRRFGIPLLYLVVAFLAGTLSLKIGLMCLALCVALHLGYGDNSNWFMRLVYALAITLPSLIVGFNFWAIVLPIVFLGTYYLSNKPKWQYVFSWRICEAIVGFFMGILYSQVIGG